MGGREGDGSSLGGVKGEREAEAEEGSSLGGGEGEGSSLGGGGGERERDESRPMRTASAPTANGLEPAAGAGERRRRIICPGVNSHPVQLL